MYHLDKEYISIYVQFVCWYLLLLLSTECALSCVVVCIYVLGRTFYLYKIEILLEPMYGLMHVCSGTAHRLAKLEVT